MIREPIWTTWPKYKKFIDDGKVREFAQSIADNKFGGQLEIDEDWEVSFCILLHYSHLHTVLKVSR